jgi:hypothetical protein
MNDLTGGSERPPEKSGSPIATDLASLTDGRKPGEYNSIYPVGAWFQIALELVYLVAFEGPS